MVGPPFFLHPKAAEESMTKEIRRVHNKGNTKEGVVVVVVVAVEIARCRRCNYTKPSEATHTHIHGVQVTHRFAVKTRESWRIGRQALQQHVLQAISPHGTMPCVVSLPPILLCIYSLRQARGRTNRANYTPIPSQGMFLATRGTTHIPATIQTHIHSTRLTENSQPSVQLPSMQTTW